MPQFNDLAYLLTGRWHNTLPEPLNNTLLLFLVLAAAAFLPHRCWKVFRVAENAWIRVAEHRNLSLAIVGFFTVAINMTIAYRGRWPVAGIHDEFSYLLGADTFAQGRLTNPTHPMWVHFETYHVIQQPTYASKYPPAQAAMLALGQVLFHTPVAGLWIGSAIACMAICWMLQQWFKPRWALLGGILVAAHPIMIYWTQTFWGNQPAIIGAALAMGALRRVLDGDNSATGQKSTQERSSQSHSDGKNWAANGWIIGIGIALLLFTRPFEGGVLSLMLIMTILFAEGPSKHKKATRAQNSAALSPASTASSWYGLSRVLLPIGALIFATIGIQCFYNSRVTHNALLLPYEQHERTYGVSPLFMWQSFKPEPIYHHPLMRRSHVLEEPPAFLHHRTPAVLFNVAVDKLIRLILLHCQSAAMIGALLLFPFVLTRDRRLLIIFGITLAFVAALLLEVWFLPHYATAILPAATILSMQGFRRLRAWRLRNRRYGLYIARLLVALSLVSVASSFAAIARPGSDGIIYTMPALRAFASHRAHIQQQLEATPGSHLVIVRYQPTHNNSFEWVYNRADIDDAKVVWARSMSPVEDREVIEYFRAQNRKIWFLDADATPPRLQRLAAAALS